MFSVRTCSQNCIRPIQFKQKAKATSKQLRTKSKGRLHEGQLQLKYSWEELGIEKASKTDCSNGNLTQGPRINSLMLFIVPILNIKDGNCSINLLWRCILSATIGPPKAGFHVNCWMLLHSISLYFKVILKCLLWHLLKPFKTFSIEQQN